MGIWKKIITKGSKGPKSKALGGPKPGPGNIDKSKSNKLSDADQSLFDARTSLQKNMDQRASEMSVWDLDGPFSKKQWAAGAGAAATGAGYLGLGHQGKHNKKKDDTLKFLGY